MHRRPIWLALSVVTPLVLAWWALAAASWRPVAIGEIHEQGDNSATLLASDHRVLFFKPYSYRLLAVEGNSSKTLRFGEWRVTGLEKDAFWSFNQGVASHIGVVKVENRDKEFKFPFAHPDFRVGEQLVSFRLLHEENKAVLLFQDHIYTWNLASAQLERHKQAKAKVGGAAVLSRDARTFIAFGSELENFYIGDARTGQVQHTVPLQITFFESLYLSPYGKYAMCEQPANTRLIKVVEVATGKPLWGFDAPNGGNSDWTISDDEHTIFVRSGKQWQVRDLKTGTIEQRLPTVPRTSVAASSPDGALLYSVTNTVLYRQRVR